MIAAGTRIARGVLVQIADDALEESFFNRGDNLAAATTQFELLTVADEQRRRGVKALIVTGAILLFTILVLCLLLPAPTSDAASRKPEHGAKL